LVGKGEFGTGFLSGTFEERGLYSEVKLSLGLTKYRVMKTYPLLKQHTIKAHS
jgi:hypothetical protein